MADQEKPADTGAAAPAAGVPAVRIIPDIPVLFADGVMSQAFAPGISKFFLYRTDTAPNVLEGTFNVPVLQVVMTAHGFASMLHFFEHRLRLMIDGGAISQEMVDQIKKTVYDDPRANPADPAPKK